MIRIIAFLLFLVAGTHGLHAQNPGGSDSTKSAAATTSDTGFVMAKSPLGAMLRSAVLPGWGQFYNESYWKIPVIVGLSAWLIRGIVQENSSYLTYRDKYAASITPTSPSGNLIYKQFREFYRDNRDSYAWYLGLFYLLQVADAYIDAHLFDFSVSDEVHAAMLLLPSGRVNIRIAF